MAFPRENGLFVRMMPFRENSERHVLVEIFSFLRRDIVHQKRKKSFENYVYGLGRSRKRCFRHFNEKREKK